MTYLKVELPRDLPRTDCFCRDSACFRDCSPSTSSRSSRASSVSAGVATAAQHTQLRTNRRQVSCRHDQTGFIALALLILCWMSTLGVSAEPVVSNDGHHDCVWKSQEIAHVDSFSSASFEGHGSAMTLGSLDVVAYSLLLGCLACLASLGRICSRVLCLGADVLCTRRCHSPRWSRCIRLICLLLLLGVVCCAGICPTNSCDSSCLLHSQASLPASSARMLDHVSSRSRLLQVSHDI